MGLAYTIVQTLPSFRSHPLVVKAVGYNFALASLAQCLWTIAFGLEYLVISLVCMVGILIPLLSTLSKTANSKLFPAANSKKEYWLLKFPFEIHAAWILAATCLNVNVIFVGADASASVQTTVGWTCLGLLFAAGLYGAVAKRNYDRVWTVPCVVAWASFAINRELSRPRDKIVATFSESTISHTKIAAAIVAAALVVLVIVESVRVAFFSNSNRSDAAAAIEAEADDEGNEIAAGGQYSSL